MNGQCDTTCPQVWPFVFVLFLGILFTFLTVTPISMAILRYWPSSLLPLALINVVVVVVVVVVMVVVVVVCVCECARARARACVCVCVCVCV